MDKINVRIYGEGKPVSVMSGLNTMITCFCKIEKPSFEQKLVGEMMQEVNKRLAKKTIDNSLKVNLNLTKAEAYAFLVLYTRCGVHLLNTYEQRCIIDIATTLHKNTI